MDIIFILKGFVLGIVEGVTEFIPVSSTGHLIVAGTAIGFEGEKAKIFEVFIQLGAILSILWIYREKVFGVVSTLSSRSDSRAFVVNILTAFLPAAFIGLIFHKTIKAYLFNPVSVACALIVGGIAILFIEKMNHRMDVASVDAITFRQALLVGFFQCLALFPGVSRSGATIMGGLVIGFNRTVAAEFSFFLAIPTMFAATGYDLLKHIDILSIADLPLFAVGFITAFLSAVVVVKAFIGFISRHSFSGFAWYRIAFGIAVLLIYWRKGWIF